MATMNSCLPSTSTTPAIWPSPAAAATSRKKSAASVVRCGAIKMDDKNMAGQTMSRREAMAASVLAGMAMAAVAPSCPALANLCETDTEFERELANIPRTTTASGLQYKDIVVGSGGSPPASFQDQNYVAMIPNGKVFDSSLENGVPYIFRVGAKQVIKGLDEGIMNMKAGGKRRLYIPGEVAFPNGLGAVDGRRIPLPSTPVVFDVCLVHIPVSYFDA